MTDLNTRKKGLEPTGKLPPRGWLTAPETEAVMQALTAYGADARFVGGCIRNALSGKEVTDIDIGTPDRPETVIGLLETAGIRALPTGIDHGTVTAVIDGKRFEITTLRRDVKTDGRHAEVEYTDDWLQDAKRRDFTINYLSAQPNGDIYDPGTGISDLAYGWVRFVGRASDRIAEDHLRILRYYRFFGSFSQSYVDVDARAACKAGAELLTQLSGERIRDEFLKILVLDDPAEIIVKMRGDRVLDHILPEAGDVNLLRLVNWFETRAIRINGIEPDPIRHLASLLDVDRQGVREVAERLKLSRDQTDRLIDTCSPPVKIDPEMGKLAENKALRSLGTALVEDLALVNWAAEMSENPRLPRQRKEAWIALLERCTTWKSPVFPLSGKDVLALGVEPGPNVGRALTKVEQWWENGLYQADRQACLERLAKEIK